jgi:hypothetical protein
VLPDNALSSWEKQEQHSALEGFFMDKSASNTTPKTYVDIENRIIDKYLRRIGVDGLAVYTIIKRHLNDTPPTLSYATIARKIGVEQETLIRHVKKLRSLHLLPPDLRFTEEEEG